MTVLAADVNLNVSVIAGSLGQEAVLDLNETCFVGSMLSRDPATGALHRLVAGEQFAGFAMKQIVAAYWKAIGAAQGDVFLPHACGIGYFRPSGTMAVTQSDAVNRRNVYASDDATLTFNAFTGAGLNNSIVGEVVDIISTTTPIIRWYSDEFREASISNHGMEQIADAAFQILTRQMGKAIFMTPTAPRIITLPVTANCIGQMITIANGPTGGAFALTISGSGAEKIAQAGGPAGTLVQAATAGRSTTLLSTGQVGAEWAVISNQ